ncbi:addiction module antidote protein [Methylomonas sp. AM2-LC]|uniref:helix-turn-helix domain-containing transcriptional regulator n=1 Tax=Methylomonas sp. AM2-LC TaxID=3153301 RepID=UPI0032655F9D
MKEITHADVMEAKFRENPDYVIELLNTILADGDQGQFLIVLGKVAKAFGGLQMVAESAELNPTHLYRTLSEKGNPALSNFSAILRALGLRFSVQPLQSPSGSEV